MIAHGYCVTRAGELLVPTVSSTERGAQVNYLVAYGRIFVPDTASDELIAGTFQTLALVFPIKLLPVTISETT